MLYIIMILVLVARPWTDVGVLGNRLCRLVIITHYCRSRVWNIEVSGSRKWVGPETANIRWRSLLHYNAGLLTMGARVIELECDCGDNRQALEIKFMLPKTPL